MNFTITLTCKIATITFHNLMKRRFWVTTLHEWAMHSKFRWITHCGITCPGLPRKALHSSFIFYPIFMTLAENTTWIKSRESSKFSQIRQFNLELFALDCRKNLYLLHSMFIFIGYLWSLTCIKLWNGWNSAWFDNYIPPTEGEGDILCPPLPHCRRVVGLIMAPHRQRAV